MSHYPSQTPCPSTHGAQSGAYNSSLAARHRSNPNTAAHAAAPFIPHLRPSRTSIFARAPDTIFGEDYGEETENLQYTTEMHQQMGASMAKPRRRLSLAPSRRAGRGSIAIHEDKTAMAPIHRVNEDEDFELRASIRGTPKKLSVPRGISVSPEKRAQLVKPPRRRRVSAILADRLASEKLPHISNENNGSLLKKEVRRRTIFIPDNTTVMTIHPGAGELPRDDTLQPAARRASKSNARRENRRGATPDLGLDLVTLSEGPESPYPVLKVRGERSDKKSGKRNSLAVPPRRMPLGASNMSTQRQSVAFAQDTHGAPTGKENLAPGVGAKALRLKDRDNLARSRLSMYGLQESHEREVMSPNSGKRKGTDSVLEFSPKPRKLKTSKPTAKTRARAVVRDQLGRTGGNVHFSLPAEDETVPIAASKPEEAERLIESTARRQCQIPTQYPILTEDLAQPSLYEDAWLHHQEISLSQLLNSIFNPQTGFHEPQRPEDLRKQFLSLYNDAKVPLLYKRLQASLLYGALTIPQDMIARVGRVREDVGLKRQFLNLWTGSYELAPLRVALEVVVGRSMPVPRPSGSSQRSSSGSELAEKLEKVKRRVVERFIETFLIQHEDALRPGATIGRIAKSTGQKDGENDVGSRAWAWRRTVLRSLMLIQLLDKAKRSSIVSGCLFQARSPMKSSAAFLTALAGMLLPSLGDVARPLSHLNYTVEAVQYPLEEHSYAIDNLATDLRDGVKLTHLVELMLFPCHPSTSSTRPIFVDANNTMTLSLPSGDTLTSFWSGNTQRPWILSQHLKFPCLSRPQKVYNVQIALSALQTLGGAAAKACEGISAEDIVDGHRERTLSLLWAIVGYCGLASLVDWRALSRETLHFRALAKTVDITDGFCDIDKEAGNHEMEPPSLKRCTKLLLNWACSIAAQRGLNVTNFTTSFADPRILAAVVDAYLPYFPVPGPGSATAAGASEASLATKLTTLGCSTAFTTLYTSSNAPSVPSKSHTVSTLAFLASRLLPAARTHRAATAIQRAWRGFQGRRQRRQRIVLARLAHHCAVVARTRERVVGAAVILQRAWRGVLRGRIEELERGVVGVQALARGWVVRERLRTGGRARAGRIVGW